MPGKALRDRSLAIIAPPTGPDRWRHTGPGAPPVSLVTAVVLLAASAGDLGDRCGRSLASRA